MKLFCSTCHSIFEPNVVNGGCPLTDCHFNRLMVVDDMLADVTKRVYRIGIQVKGSDFGQLYERFFSPGILFTIPIEGGDYDQFFEFHETMDRKAEKYKPFSMLVLPIKKDDEEGIYEIRLAPEIEPIDIQERYMLQFRFLEILYEGIELIEMPPESKKIYLERKCKK